MGAEVCVAAIGDCVFRGVAPAAPLFILLEVETMKRVISFILATVLLLGLCACGNSKETTAEPTAEPTEEGITKDTIIGKTFTSGRLGVTAEEDPELCITFEKDGIVDCNRNIDLFWNISDDRVLLSRAVYNSSSYLYCDGYLVAENSSIASNGMIPEGDTFKATITVLNPYREGKIVLFFKDDGTYTARDGGDIEESERYVREGNIIKLYFTDTYGEEIVMYLYYAGEDTIYNTVLFPEE